MKSDVHLNAEWASIQGHAKSIAKYLRSVKHPAFQVIHHVSRHLRGDSELQLKFTIRNGRPPKTREAGGRSLWLPGKEVALAGRLLLLGNELSIDPSATERRVIRDDIARLADALDPEGSSKWKLVYGRGRIGNPNNTEMRQIKLGLQAEMLYARPGAQTWAKVCDELHLMGYSADERQMRRAVELVRQHRQK